MVKGLQKNTENNRTHTHHITNKICVAMLICSIVSARFDNALAIYFRLRGGRDRQQRQRSSEQSWRWGHSRASWCIGSPADWIKLYPLSTSWNGINWQSVFSHSLFWPWCSLDTRSAMSRNTPHRLWQSFDPLLTSQWLDPTPKIAVKHSQTKRLRPGVLNVPNDGSIHGNSFVQSCAVLLAWAKERGILFFQHFMSCYRYAFGSLPRAILTLVQFVSLDFIAGSSGFQRNGWNVMGKLVQLRSNSPGFPDIATPGFDLLWTAHSLEWKHPSSWCIIYCI